MYTPSSKIQGGKQSGLKELTPSGHKIQRQKGHMITSLCLDRDLLFFLLYSADVLSCPIQHSFKVCRCWFSSHRSVALPLSSVCANSRSWKWRHMQIAGTFRLGRVSFTIPISYTGCVVLQATVTFKLLQHPSAKGRALPPGPSHHNIPYH